MKMNRLVTVAGIVLVAVCLIVAAGNASAQQKKQAPEQKQETLKGKTVNINKATAEDFVKNVPLITPELAKKIVKYRQENGDFQVLEEILQVEGFNRTLLNRIKPFLLLEGIGGDECTC
jgi:competence ComEA-like helix-hairpin-helix protein